MMKASERKVSFSSPIKSSASPQGSDENVGSNHEMGLNLQNPKKQIVKIFMSLTVSAVSKASFPRKKILAERNESLGSNSSNTYLSKTPNLDSKPSPKTVPKASPKTSPNLDPKGTTKEPSSQKTPLSYNSRDETPSPGPYDPLTNYLSPRPQFLRYNPSRRKEIFLRLEMEDNEGDNELSVSSTASFDPKKAASDEADIVHTDNSSLASSFSQEDEEFGDESWNILEQEDEELDIGSDEEAEEEVEWSLRGVLKHMLLLVLLVLTTSYISSMNSPTRPRDFQGLTLGYQTTQNHSHGIVESVEFGYKFFHGKQEQLGLNRSIVYEVVEEKMAENINTGEIVSVGLEDRNVEFEEIVEEVKKDEKSEAACGEEFIESVQASDQFAEDVGVQEKETVEKIEVEKAEDVKENGVTEDAIEDELMKTGKVSDQLVEGIQLQEIEECGEYIEDVEKVEDVKENGESLYVIEEELVESVEVSDQLVEDIVLQEREESVEQIEDVKETGESQDFIEEELVKRGEVSDQTVGGIELLKQETTGEIAFLQGDQACEEIHEEAGYNDLVQGKIIRFGNAINMASAVTILKRWGKYVTLNFEEMNPLKEINQLMGTEILVKGFLICAAIVASLVLGSNMRRKGIASKHSSLVDKHSTQPVVKEKPSLVVPAEGEEHKMHVNSILNTMPLISSADKDIKETYQSRAPSAELLGEFEVGGIGSSLKSCAVKSGMIDEVSSYSYFQEKGLRIKAYSVPVQDQKDSSEISILNSGSSKRLTAEKKPLSQELGNNDMAGVDGEGRDNMVTTPLRRSARIRNRAVAASP
ncbi:hypothetical protein DITRI_Ditri02bG0086300 [Diplodiscus trichospermus]